MKQMNVKRWLLAASSLGMALSVAVACGDPGNEPDSFPDSWGGGPSDGGKKPEEETGSGGGRNPEPTDPELACADWFEGGADSLTWNEEQVRIQLADTEAEVESARLIISGAECYSGGGYYPTYNFIDLEVQEDNVLQLSASRLLTALPLNRFDEVQLELRFKDETELQARWLNAKSWNRPVASEECGEPEVPEWLPVNWCATDHAWQEPSGQPENLSPPECEGGSSCGNWGEVFRVETDEETGLSQVKADYWSKGDDPNSFERILDARLELALCDCSANQACVAGTESHLVLPAVSEQTEFDGTRELVFSLPEGFDWRAVAAAEVHLETECEQLPLRIELSEMRCGEAGLSDPQRYLFPRCLAGVE